MRCDRSSLRARLGRRRSGARALGRRPASRSAHRAPNAAASGLCPPAADPSRLDYVATSSRRRRAPDPLDSAGGGPGPRNHWRPRAGAPTCRPPRLPSPSDSLDRLLESLIVPPQSSRYSDPTQARPPPRRPRRNLPRPRRKAGTPARAHFRAPYRLHAATQPHPRRRPPRSRLSNGIFVMCRRSHPQHSVSLTSRGRGAQAGPKLGRNRRPREPPAGSPSRSGRDKNGRGALTRRDAGRGGRNTATGYRTDRLHPAGHPETDGRPGGPTRDPPGTSQSSDSLRRDLFNWPHGRRLSHVLSRRTRPRPRPWLYICPCPSRAAGPWSRLRWNASARPCRRGSVRASSRSRTRRRGAPALGHPRPGRRAAATGRFTSGRGGRGGGASPVRLPSSASRCRTTCITSTFRSRDSDLRVLFKSRPKRCHFACDGRRSSLPSAVARAVSRYRSFAKCIERVTSDLTHRSPPGTPRPRSPPQNEADPPYQTGPDSPSSDPDYHGDGTGDVPSDPYLDRYLPESFDGSLECLDVAESCSPQRTCIKRLLDLPHRRRWGSGAGANAAPRPYRCPSLHRGPRAVHDRSSRSDPGRRRSGRSLLSDSRSSGGSDPGPAGRLLSLLSLDVALSLSPGRTRRSKTSRNDRCLSPRRRSKSPWNESTRRPSVRTKARGPL